MFKNEYWKEIPGFEKYEASTDGRIRNKKTKRIRKQQKIKNGYMQVSLYAGQTTALKPLYVHRLVAITFIDNPNNYPEVNHKDGDITNNGIDNLEWCDRGHNIWYSRLKAEGCI